MKYGWMILVCASLAMAACDKKEGGDDPAATSEGADTSAKDGKEGAATDPKEAMEEVAEAAKFDKEMRKKACEILTAEMVAEVLEVNAADLKQMKIMGCSYNWSEDGQTVEARFGSIRVHDDTARAKKWFANATKGMTAKEVEEAMAKVAERAKKDERIDTEEKKAAVGSIAKSAGKMGAITFEDVDGVGDEARLNTGDGDLWVRKGNMTFTVAAYKGKELQAPPMKGGDMKGFAAKMRELDKAHKKETMPQRKDAATKLTKAILAKL